MWDLAYQAKTHSLYAASFGRGAYSLPLAGLTVPIPGEPGCICPPPRQPTGPQGPKGPDSIPSTGLPATLPLAALGALGAAVLVARKRRAA